jgi:hypothetical protein
MKTNFRVELSVTNSNRVKAKQYARIKVRVALIAISTASSIS